MKTAYTNHPPENFFTELNEDKLPGKVYVHDARLPAFAEDPETGRSRWVPRYAYPTREAIDIANDYPLGCRISSMEVIVWSKGRLLTVINKSPESDNFRFDLWAGLTGEETRCENLA